jgi:hypothetical protein
VAVHRVTRPLAPPGPQFRRPLSPRRLLRLAARRCRRHVRTPTLSSSTLALGSPASKRGEKGCGSGSSQGCEEAVTRDAAASPTTRSRTLTLLSGRPSLPRPENAPTSSWERWALTGNLRRRLRCCSTSGTGARDGDTPAEGLEAAEAAGYEGGIAARREGSTTPADDATRDIYLRAEEYKVVCTHSPRWRIVTSPVQIRVGSSCRRFTTLAHPSDTIELRAEGYTYAATVWALSVVQRPFSVAPCQTQQITVRHLMVFSPARAAGQPALHARAVPRGHGGVHQSDRVYR